MAGEIRKIQTNPNNYKISFLYYDRARDAMFDVVNELFKLGYTDIYIPGYIGWSPKEGSGIFDPLEAISDLSRHYYRMNKELRIDKNCVKEQLKEHSILLVVNYFGFRDPDIKEIVDFAHCKDCVVIEDNAHGFYTYFCYGSVESDITFFSLHKMFPFDKGGGLVTEKVKLDRLHNITESVDFDPFKYDYNGIAKKRLDNYEKLLSLSYGKETYFEPFRGKAYLADNIPQTFPILINMGDRNKIYQIMNNAGYGVVSLYHTMIEELRTGEHRDAIWLSQRIMNLPVHQDVDKEQYDALVECLVKACKDTR